MRTIALIVITASLICGCSASGGPVAPDDQKPLIKRPLQLPQEGRWMWDIGLYHVSEDHQTIERLPLRMGGFHLNMNKYVEPPNCADCLIIGNPQVQPDGTIKVKVTLRHPFPGQPKYTGFNVRGTIMFPATRYWKQDEPLYPSWPDYYFIFHDFIPLYFSHRFDGGGQLLNADGYSFYLWPGLYLGPYFDAPIFNYGKGQCAQGPDPDSTVNGFKLFTGDLFGRRMFLVSDTISRTYHIAPPEGGFTFGYVVDACWAPPTKTPVTDPANDFPFWANAEDGCVIKLEQLEPFKTGTYSPDGPLYSYDITEATIYMYKEEGALEIFTYLFCGDIDTDGNGIVGGKGWSGCPPEPGIYPFKQVIGNGTYSGPPGKYPALFFCNLWYYNWMGEEYPVQMLRPLQLAVFDLEVIAGDG